MIDPASVVDTTDDERREYLRVLYESCATGREFELFLKLLLSAMKLEDVSVTRYSRDGGVDLTARRAGITGDRFDEVRYVLQAKRYAPDRTVPIESVRALRGVLTQTSKGMFITTGRFSDDTERFVEEDPSRPIVLVDGLTLIANCIQLGVGFRFRPVLEQAWLLQQIGQLPAAVAPATAVAAVDTRTFLKTITANDIRARIISLPWEIDDLLPPHAKSLRIAFPPHVPVEKQRLACREAKPVTAPRGEATPAAHRQFVAAMEREDGLGTALNGLVDKLLAAAGTR